MKLAVVVQGYTVNSRDRQPWLAADELARRLTAEGHHVTIITDGQGGEREQVGLPSRGKNDCAVVRVPKLFRGMLPSSGLLKSVETLAVRFIYIVTGLTGLMRASRFWLPVDTALVMASPRYRLAELLRAGVLRRTAESRILRNTILGSLIPDAVLRAGYRISRACQVVYLSEGTRQRLLAALPFGEVLSTPPRLPIAHARSTHDNDDITITYFGPAHRFRGVGDLVQAFEVLADRTSHVRLVMCIRTSTEDECRSALWLAKQVKATRNSHRIEVVTGSLNDVDLSLRLSEASVIALPFRTVISESPTVVAEALAFGVPVVFRAVPGIAEADISAANAVIAKGNLVDALMMACDLERSGGSQGNLPFTAPLEGVVGPAKARHVFLVGVDGSGKSTIAGRLAAAYEEAGTTPVVIWTRHRNYTAKPLLGIGRLLGYSRLVCTGTRVVRVHHYESPAWMRSAYQVLRMSDVFIDTCMRYRKAGTNSIIGDRAPIDSIVDIVAATNDFSLLDGYLPVIALKLLPTPREVIIIRRPSQDIAEARPETAVDNTHARREAAYATLARRFSLPVLDNREVADLNVDRIDGLVSRSSR